MQIEFFPIAGGASVLATVDDEPFDAGGEGRVYHATVDGVGRCVKAIPNVSPGELSTIAGDIGRLIQQIQRAMSRSPARVVGATLEGLAARLPTHLASQRLDGDARWLLFLRSLQVGESLQALCNQATIPSRQVRFQLARQLVGYLTTLQLYGCVHLDPYPDNVLVELGSNSNVVSLIDLEYLGITATTNEGRMDWSADRFIRKPRSFGKPDTWLLPEWYPQSGSVARQPIADLFVAAATWQALSVVFYALTWGCTPFSWLTPDAFRQLAQRPLSNAAALSDHDVEASKEISDRLGRNDLYRSMVVWFTDGFVRHTGHWPLPPLKEIQDAISQITLSDEPLDDTNHNVADDDDDDYTAGEPW